MNVKCDQSVEDEVHETTTSGLLLKGMESCWNGVIKAILDGAPIQNGFGGRQEAMPHLELKLGLLELEERFLWSMEVWSV